MMVLISSNNLMAMYLGIELQSLSLYVLATIQRNSIKSAESGIKYFVLGALSSGLFLYGCSLIYGFTGSTNYLIINENFTVENIGLIFGSKSWISSLVTNCCLTPSSSLTLISNSLLFKSLSFQI